MRLELTEILHILCERGFLGHSSGQLGTHIFVAKIPLFGQKTGVNGACM